MKENEKKIKDFDEMMRIAMTPWIIAADEAGALKRFEEKVWEVVKNESYEEATKTHEWWMAKNILFTRKKEQNRDEVVCYWCGKQLDFHKCTMHHTAYDPLFDLENVEFVCYDCHKAIHNK
ncbi:MAG: hypothetical protein ACOC1X_00060 [Promethearchaeota archaeon]